MNEEPNELLCGKQYPSKDPTARIVRCTLIAGHTPTTEHEETETGARWSELDPAQVVGTREWMAQRAAGRHPGTVHLIKLFAWAHLPARLAVISKDCGSLALTMMGALGDGPELTAGLRKLREAKDCFVTQALEDQTPGAR